MPIKPVLMSDLRRIPINSPSNLHSSQIGNGYYNRFEPLTQRPRLSSTGKRQLSPGASAPPSFKFPRLDSNKMFEKLQGQDNLLAAAKADIETANNAISASCKPDDGGMGTALFKLSSALSNIISSNEAMKSSIISLQVPKTFSFGSQSAPLQQEPDPDAILKNKVKTLLEKPKGVPPSTTWTLAPPRPSTRKLLPEKLLLPSTRRLRGEPMTGHSPMPLR